MHDPIIHGAIAGLTGGIVQAIYGFTVKTLYLTDRIFMDYGEIIVLGHRSSQGNMSIIGLIAHLINAAVWGVLFSFMMKFGRKKYYIAKGLGLGVFIWLLSLGLATIYQIPLFKDINEQQAYVLLIGASIYGLVLSWIYRYLDQKMLSDGSLETQN